MKQRVARWLRRQPDWARYVAGYVLIVVVLLGVVEYRGRPAAQALSTVPVSHAPAHQHAPARRAPASLPLTVNPSAGNPPAPARIFDGASAQVVRRPLALHVVCRGGVAPHLMVSVPASAAPVPGGSGAAWDLGSIGQANRIQLTLDVAGCRS